MKPVVPTSTEAARPVDLVGELRGLIADARQQTAHVVNATLTALHWQIGTRIRQYVLGEERAAYGAAVVASLGKSLASEFGRGFDEKSLRHMLGFAEAFPDPDIVSALRRELSWTHFKQLNAEYLTELPPREVLQARFHAAITTARARLAQEPE